MLGTWVVVGGGDGWWEHGLWSVVVGGWWLALMILVVVGNGDGWWERGLRSVVVNIKSIGGWLRSTVDWGWFWQWW